LIPFGMAAQDLAPEVLLLARIKAHVRQEFSRLADYTCLETLERFQRPPGMESDLGLIDTVRLEVLYSGGREFYASPNDSRFSEDDPARFVSGGVIGNGIFALFLKSVFLDDTATVQYAGEESLDGRPAAKYDFRIPQFLSGYTINLVGGSGTAGLSGSFWADPHTLDLVRLETRAEDIPPFLPIQESTASAEYGRVRLGQRDVLMVQSGSMNVLENSGQENRSHIEFTHCRLFHAQSALRFEEPAAAPEAVPRHVENAPARPPERERFLVEAVGVAPLLTVTVELVSPITDKDAVGRLIEGRVFGDVKRKGKVVIANGSTVKGRVRGLQRAREPGWFIVSLEFTEIQVNGTWMRFYADLQGIQGSPKNGIEIGERVVSRAQRSFLLLDRQSTIRKIKAERKIFLPQLPGVASFFAAGNSLRLPQPLRMVWRTR
ncbi:MAG: polymer-forming cytoskeletal protein, partial [Acidobacteria bacterium]|nr:polymer-forming cytoskeletal protein [Acidobacteriota bacterium]